MAGFILFLFFFAVSALADGAGAALSGMLSALGIDVLTTLITGGSLSQIILGAGMADDAFMLLFSRHLNLVQKLALSVFTDESMHVAHEAYEHYDHTDAQNRAFSRYLQYHEPGQTYLFGDVTPRDLITLGISYGVLAKTGVGGTILDAAKSRFGELWDLTADVIEVGGI